MPSLHYQRKQRKQQRRERKKIKRKIQGFLLISAFIVSIVICIYNQFVELSVDNTKNTKNINSRRLLKSFDDGYYINSLNEFPPLLFSLEGVRNGAWILFFVGMFYCFLGIAIICDDYFVPAIEVIVEKLNMSEDTAGATWMAAGGSAPELFTSFVGTFLAKSDVGFGTIVGSAVFNVLFIVGACALFTPGNLKLQWWPFARDMSYYLICLAMLSIFFGGVSKNQMYWWESTVLLLMYFLYVFIMARNEKIKAWVYRGFIVDGQQQKLLSDARSGYGADTEISMQKKPKHKLVSDEEQDNFNGDAGATTKTVENGGDFSLNSNSDYHTGGDIDIDIKNHKKNNNGDDDDDSDDEEGLDLAFPDTFSGRIWYIMKMPLTYPIYYTLFDVSDESNMDWWPWTFFGCLLWLGGLSYLMVWWAVVVGYAWTVPQEIMGLVFLAAGTSVPELFSCIIVAKKGQADMAVAASIGSNIFDVLVGLPLPWLSYSIIYGEASGDLRIDVQAHGLFLSILVLIAMLSCLLFIILFNKWILTHCMGYSMIALWLIFIAQDLLRHYFLDIEF